MHSEGKPEIFVLKCIFVLHFYYLQVFSSFANNKYQRFSSCAAPGASHFYKALGEMTQGQHFKEPGLEETCLQYSPLHGDVSRS